MNIPPRLYKKIFFAILPLVILVAFNYTPIAMRLTNSLWFFDKTLHFLGGACVAYGFINIMRAWLPSAWNNQPLLIKIIFVIAVVALGGVVWEIYEFIWDVIFKTSYQPNNHDTMLDLINDLTGGVLGAIFLTKERP